MIDIQTYFTSTHSFYTAKQLKAHKSLEAYKYFEADFVRSINFVKKLDKFIAIGKVSLKNFCI